MKRGLFILLALIVASSMFAFTQGTINPGGTVSFASQKPNDKVSAITMIQFAPQAGYFVIDNLAVDLLLNYVSASQGKSDYNDEESSSAFGIGLGGRYFYQKFYGGLGFMSKSWSYKHVDSDGTSESDWSGMYVGLKAGYLLPIVENVHVDLGLGYDMGLGSYGGKAYENAPDDAKKNKESKIGINAGLQVFFPIK